MFSIIIPLYNEEKTIPELVTRLAAVTDGMSDPWELILVDDGSTDGSFTAMCALHRNDPRIKVVRLSRNALDLAQGDAVILMDGDLQDPPELLPQLIKLWKDGYHVVYTVKTSRKENWLKRLAFKSFYRILSAMSSIKIPMDAGNFSLMDRRVVEVLRTMPERNRYISGLRAWAGFQQTAVYYDRGPRFAGKPQMSLGRLFHLALDGIFSFSNAPLRAAIYFGMAAAMVSFAGGLYVVYEKLFTNLAILGWASTIVSILFVGGMILMTLGVIGEYISRIYEEVKKRPLYVIRDKIGF